MLEKGSIEACQAFIKKHSQNLHPNHYYLQVTKPVPYLHQKIANWALDILLFWCVGDDVAKFVPISTIKSSSSGIILFNLILMLNLQQILCKINLNSTRKLVQIRFYKNVGTKIYKYLVGRIMILSWIYNILSTAKKTFTI